MTSEIAATICKPEAFFIPGVFGNLFAVYIPPHEEKYAGDNVLIIPPFAEEMMRVRRMMSLQARKLSSMAAAAAVPTSTGVTAAGSVAGLAAVIQCIDTRGRLVRSLDTRLLYGSRGKRAKSGLRFSRNASRPSFASSLI